jgi:protein arginine N-methyltransferase 5
MASDKKVVLMVVGAGRGPLVKCALRAATAAKRELQVYAVEKNPNAVVTLRNMKDSLPGWKNVTLVHMDMRQWKPPQLADILVSELLGSWGDNELSPECLDGAQRLLKPDTGISIPCEYTSFVSPVMTPRLWNEVRSFSDELKAYETPYVVKLHNFSALSPAQACFTFVHPNKKSTPEDETNKFVMNTPSDIDNSRFKTLSFTASEDATVHGFAGYFEAYLYKDVMISINPATFSTGMFSWFPVYIPLRQPMTVKRGDQITAQFWRHVASSKVWYEWGVTSPACSPVHNPNGRSYFVGLFTS